MASTLTDRDIPLRKITASWWPLAASWLLMGLEGPALAAVIARLPDPKINLAAYGGIVFPLALIIESPIIMLLAASTALSKDWASFARMRRYMMISSAFLTGLHILIVFTPLYDLLVGQIIGAPQEILEPGRIGLMIMIPWTWSIAYRRFHQGVLIRFNHTRVVGVGTAVRLGTDCLVLAVGAGLAVGTGLGPIPYDLAGMFSGIAVATAAQACGVVSEAIYIGWAVRPVLRNELRFAPVAKPALTLRSFLIFYIPLALTSLLNLLANPIGSAALSRMPLAISSLAVWPIVTGLSFMLRSMGIALNEVVVAMLDNPGSSRSLRRFSYYLAAATTVGWLLITATPLAGLYFEKFTALPADLVDLAIIGAWIALPLPALSVFQSWYQGAILHSHKTRAITESVVIYLLTSALVLGLGVASGQVTGLYIGLWATVLSVLSQTAWLWLRSRQAIREVTLRDREMSE